MNPLQAGYHRFVSKTLRAQAGPVKNALASPSPSVTRIAGIPVEYPLAKPAVPHPTIIVKEQAIMSNTTLPAAPTPGQIMQTLLSTLKLDAITAAGGLLSNALQNIKQNPTHQNVAAQAAILAVSAMADGPALEPVVIGQVADTALQLVQAGEALAKG